jgi:hypothetical protein
MGRRNVESLLGFRGARHLLWQRRFAEVAFGGSK